MIQRLIRTTLSLLSNRVPSTMPEMTEQRREQLLEPLQPGDVVMATVGTLPGWAHLDYWLLDSHHVHCGLYAGDGQFYEAAGPGVRRSQAPDFFHGRMKTAAIRPNYASAEDRQAALAYCEKQLGKAFDQQFRSDDDRRFYCSELVHNALKNMPHPILSPTHRVPLRGDQGIPPDGFLRIDGKLLYDEKSHYWKNALHHWPVALGTVSGAALGALAGNLTGACLGGLAGTLGAVALGNYLQTGECFPKAK